MIGIFDSGFGGLTTVRALLRLLPTLDILFLGDNARAPYGNRSTEIITQYTEEGVRFLFSRGAELVLIACNTASSDALRLLQERFGPEKKILGVLVPTIERALEVSRFGRIGVVGTRNTVATESYKKEINKKFPLFFPKKDSRSLAVPQVISVACPLLVPFIEEGVLDGPEINMLLKKYLRPLKNAHIDTLVLGCTHYPLLLPLFQKRMGAQVVLIDSGEAQAQKTVRYLQNHPERDAKISRTSTLHFCTTDDPHRFWTMAETFLCRSLPRTSIEKVSLLQNSVS